MFEPRAMSGWATLWLLVACDPSAPTRTPEPGQPEIIPAVVTVLRTSSSGVTTPATLIIQTHEAWTSAWTEIHANLSPAPPVPAVDFETSSLVLDALGNVADGRTIEILAVELEAGGVVIRTASHTPGLGCVVPAVITQPLHVVRVPRPPIASVLLVERRPEFQDCG